MFYIEEFNVFGGGGCLFFVCAASVRLFYGWELTIWSMVSTIVKNKEVF